MDGGVWQVGQLDAVEEEEEGVELESSPTSSPRLSSVPDWPAGWRPATGQPGGEALPNGKPVSAQPASAQPATVTR